jgi:hypothetical protein
MATTQGMTPKTRFPKIEDGEEGAIDFRNHHFAEYNTYRIRQMQRIVRAIFYDLGRQWIELDTQLSAGEGGRGYHFREQQGSAGVDMPRPVTNHVAPAIDVEFATLAKRQWQPKIPTFSRDPRMEAAAKVANEVLSDRLKKLGWDDLRDRHIRNMITMGTSILKSYWDESFYETSWVSEQEAAVCNQCHRMFASKEVPAGLPEHWAEGKDYADFEETPDTVELGNCPNCGSTDIGPLELDEETSHQTDMFGRPLGRNVPKGNTAIEVLTPFEYYPQNCGIFHTSQSVKMHGVSKIRSLDWVEEHYPEYADQIEPEDPVELLRDHPILGEWDYMGRYDVGLDAGVLDQHVRVYEMYQEPTYRFPKGRAIVIIGKTQNLVVENGDLIKEVTGADGKTACVPKVCFASAVWKPREGEFWGKSLVDDLISPQNRINGIDAQVIEARERMGSPNLIVPEDADLQGPESRSGYGSAKLFTYNLSALNPSAKPEVFGSILMPSGVYQERQGVLQDMTKIIGPADIEIGEAPRNVTTTSGLQILGEQAERRRGTREREITSSIQKVWEHQLQLLWVLRVDTDYYEAETPDGSWELKQYTRDHIKGQTKVIVEKQAYIDRSIVMREAAREAMVDGLYVLDSPLAKKKLLELRGLPTDVNEDTSLQIDHAKRIWADFVDEAKIPVVDQSIDNPSIRFQVLGTMLLQDEGKTISDHCLWPAILLKIAGWEEDLMMMDQQDAMVRQTYGGEPPPEVANEQYAKLKIAHQQALVGYQQQMQTLEMMKNAGAPIPQGPPPMPPQEPPAPVFIPRQLETRIYMVWQSMIKQHGGLNAEITDAAVKRMQNPMEFAAEVDNFLKFRAVVEAYRLLGQPSVAPGSTPGQPGAMPPPPSPGAGGPQQPPAPPSPAQPPGGNPMEQGR